MITSKLESILFASGKPVALSSLKKTLEVSDEILREAVEDVRARFNTDGSGIHVLEHEGKILSVAPPMFVELKVVEADPGLRGDTAKGGNKPVKVETGAIIQAPLFVKEGDVIKIDTRTGSYVNRI